MNQLEWSRNWTQAWILQSPKALDQMKSFGHPRPCQNRWTANETGHLEGPNMFQSDLACFEVMIEWKMEEVIFSVRGYLCHKCPSPALDSYPVPQKEPHACRKNHRHTWYLRHKFTLLVITPPQITDKLCLASSLATRQSHKDDFLPEMFLQRVRTCKPAQEVLRSQQAGQLYGGVSRVHCLPTRSTRRLSKISLNRNIIPFSMMPLQLWRAWANDNNNLEWLFMTLTLYSDICLNLWYLERYTS